MPTIKPKESEPVSKIIYDGATVYMEKSHTKNLGDFNSVKITAAVTLPVDAPKELLKKIPVAFEIASQLIDSELEDQFLSLEKIK